MKVRGDKAENDKNYSHYRSGGEGGEYTISPMVWVRDGVKLEKVVLHTKELLLLGPRS